MRVVWCARACWLCGCECDTVSLYRVTQSRSVGTVYIGVLCDCCVISTDEASEFYTTMRCRDLDEVNAELLKLAL